MLLFLLIWKTCALPSLGGARWLPLQQEGQGHITPVSHSVAKDAQEDFWKPHIAAPSLCTVCISVEGGRDGCQVSCLCSLPCFY